MQLKLVLLFAAGLISSTPAAAQDFLFNRGWTINMTGAPMPQGVVPMVIDLDQAAGLDPNLFFFVATGSPFAWTTVDYAQTAGPAPLFFGTLTSQFNGVGCASVQNATVCAPIITDIAGFYEVTASVNPAPGGMAPLPIVVGGGAAVPPMGPQMFFFNGTSDGIGYSYGLSIDPAQPAMVPMPPLPDGSPPAAFAAAIAGSIGPAAGGAYPAYAAMAAGATLTITNTAGMPFRFWIGDEFGVPRCQVTGGACEFNPTVTFIDEDLPACTDDLTAAPPSNNCLSIDTFSGGEGFASNDLCGAGDVRVADNFIPHANGLISEICWGGFYGGGADVDINPDDFRVRIYANAEDLMGNPLGRPDGLPADALETYVDGSFTVSSSLNVGTGIFEYSMDVSSMPFAVTAGTCYWLEITNNKSGNPWVWAGSVDGDSRVALDGIFLGTVPCDGYSADEVLDQSAPPFTALVTDYSFCLGLDVTPTRANTDGVCDDAPPPANDECVNAIALAIDGVPVDGRTAFGSYDATVPPCGLVNSGQNDVWYTMAVAADSNITISTNFAATDFDTTIRVYCAGTCGGTSPTDLVCYASNDDVAGATNGQSEITADFAAGSYIINVSGFGGFGAFPDEGVFQIAATDNGAALDTPDTCGTPCEVTFDGRATEIDAGCAVDATFAFDCGLDEGGAGGEESNPAGNLIVGTDAGFQGWLRADGGTRDGDTWRFEVTGAVSQVVEFDFFFEQAIIIDIFTCPEPNVSVLGGPFIFPADCEGGDLEIILDPGVYTMLMIPSYFSGSICEDDNTEYQVGFGLLPSGACCFTDGTCGDGFSNNLCVNANGGTYQGDASNCVAVDPCPEPGACCDMDNNCTFVLESECTAAGGSYQGDGVECFTPAASGTVTASTDTPIAIPEDGGTVGATSTINRADGIVVGDLVVNVNITHPDLGDVIILLGSPDGLLVEVYGFTFITCAGTADMDTTFTSNAGLGAADACATIPLGAIVDSAVPFTAFEGQTSDGDWDLIVLDADDAGTGDTGTLNSWSLEILEGTNPACPTGPACDIDGTPGVAIGDLLAFLALWFAEDPGSDFNGDGTFSNGAGTGDIADLLAFLACWFPFQ